MKIAVMGMGVAGSYLMARLKNSEHEVVGYERMPTERHDSICAWGTIKEELTNFCKKTGRNFDDFLIHHHCPLMKSILKTIQTLATLLNR